MIKSINPYTENTLKTHTVHSRTEVESILQKSSKRFLQYKNSSFEERKILMLNTAKELLKNKRLYAEMITNEMGKPITQAIAEIEKCAWVCEYYAENAEKHLSVKKIKTDAKKSYVKYEPLGVLLAIMPWNYPFWQVFRFTVPALMAGNVVVLKHASNVFGSALLIQEVFEKAGFPIHCFTTLKVGSDRVEEIIDNDIIKAVTITGSGPAGSSVAATAGKNIKKSVLELGGNNAMIVFNDASINDAIETIIQARFQNTGQSCIAGKRLLIEESIASSFIEKLSLKVSKLKSGDPIDKETFIGVMAKQNLAEKLEAQLNNSLDLGAKIEVGGKRSKTFFEPTIVSNVTPEMEIFKEETFGPLLAVTTFKNEEEAIKLSNKSKFGLGVMLFSKDIKKMEKMVPQFEEGAVFINELVKSDPRLPFGGVKTSGYGRELSSDGIKEFVNVKTVYINM
ncbi:NAD-dependent succinate-semialdehyde dehydrogenase [uncultured Planktosalinus sp.]|uniref:NAD-dependent succinate-semialdehyde dehydrogenase n=1 Tax=uncultured Planktosalinus sp. TaxID=1810935 RepID=UPI0030DDD427